MAVLLLPVSLLLEPLRVPAFLFLSNSGFACEFASFSSNKLRKFITSSSSSPAASISSIQLPAFFIFWPFGAPASSLLMFSCTSPLVATPPAKAAAPSTSILREIVSAVTFTSLVAVTVESSIEPTISLAIFATPIAAPTDTPLPSCCAFVPIKDIFKTESSTFRSLFTDNSPLSSLSSIGSSSPLFFGLMVALPALTLMF